MNRPTICLDLDGTIAKYDEWRGPDHFGEPIEGAVEFVNELAKSYRIIIYTVRTNLELNRSVIPHDVSTLKAKDILTTKVMKWLDKYGFKYDSVWAGQGKPLFTYCIDDRNIECRPQESSNPIEYYKGILRRLTR